MIAAALTALYTVSLTATMFGIGYACVWVVSEVFSG
jgi:uncharacterized membrane protein YciS (DUF1049 family)